MNKLKLLFKKDINEYVATSFKEKGKQRDWLGYVSSVLLVAFIYGVFIYVFYSFAKMHLSNVYDNVEADRVNRVGELLTFCFSLMKIQSWVNEEPMIV